MCYSIKSVAGPTKEGNYALTAYDSKNNNDVQLVATHNVGTDEYSLYLMKSGNQNAPLLITEEPITRDTLYRGMTFHVINVKNNDN